MMNSADEDGLVHGIIVQEGEHGPSEVRKMFKKGQEHHKNCHAAQHSQQCSHSSQPSRQIVYSEPRDPKPSFSEPVNNDMPLDAWLDEITEEEIDAITGEDVAEFERQRKKLEGSSKQTEHHDHTPEFPSDQRQAFEDESDDGDEVIGCESSEDGDLDVRDIDGEDIELDDDELLEDPGQEKEGNFDEARECGRRGYWEPS